MLTGDLLAPGSPALANARTPEQVAETVIHGIRDERFLIVTKPGAEEVLNEKAADYDACIDAKFKSFEEFVGQPDRRSTSTCSPQR